MASISHSPYRLTTTRSSQASASASASSNGSRQQNSGHRPSKRNYSATDRPQRLELPCSGRISPLEYVTDVVLVSNYQFVSALRPQPWDWTPGPYDTVVPDVRSRKPRVSDTRHVESSPSSWSSKRARWDDVDDRLATPPMTPYIGRLNSPELQPMKCGGEFCDCCLDEESYFFERGKMDHQGRCIRSSRSCRGWTIDCRR